MGTSLLPALAQTEWPGPRASGADGFVLMNHSSDTVTRLLVMPSASSTWAGAEIVEVAPAEQQRFSFTGEKDCHFDISVTTASGKTTELRGVDLCAATSLEFSDEGLKAK